MYSPTKMVAIGSDDLIRHGIKPVKILVSVKDYSMIFVGRLLETWSELESLNV